MHTEPRASSGRVCVIHVNVGPEKENGAQSLYDNVLVKQTGGYHWVFDNHDAIRCAADNERVEGAKGGNANAVGLHYCLIGQATQTAAEWMDDYSQAAMALCAKQVAADCKAKEIPTLRRPGEFSGICGHIDVTIAFRVRGGHTDPGPNFPWDYFLGLVRTLNLSRPSWPADWSNDVPKPTDIVDVLDMGADCWQLTADGGVRTVKGTFHGSYPMIPNQPPRLFYTITPNQGRPGYTEWATDGAFFSWPDGRYPV